MTTQFQCLSTHGGAGYAPGTRVNDVGEVICGACLEVIGHVDSESGNVWQEGCTGMLRLPGWIARYDKIIERRRNTNWFSIIGKLVKFW